MTETPNPSSQDMEPAEGSRETVDEALAQAQGDDTDDDTAEA